jgi:hypothetical protein
MRCVSRSRRGYLATVVRPSSSLSARRGCVAISKPRATLAPIC